MTEIKAKKVIFKNRDGEYLLPLTVGSTEIGDIGFTQMAIDESKGKRRAINKVDNIIIQEQYPELTKRIKATQALDPDLFCTESEWQAELTMSANGVCYKYVIDDEAGTIRLPKYPDYLDLSINGAKTVSVYGTGKTLGLTDGTNNVGLGGPSALYAKSTAYNINVKTGDPGGTNYAGAYGVVKNAQTSGLTGSVTTSSEQIKGTYFIQVATGAETEDNIINEIELNNPFFLGMSQYFETAPNNSSWLKSEGQWNAKAVYPTVYDWALINANNGIEGFKLVTDTYTDYDYVINPADETFRLPLLNGSEDLISDRSIDLTLGQAGSTYTAPANGWYSAYYQGTSNGWFKLEVGGRQRASITNTNGQSIQSGIILPVTKGTIVSTWYNGITTLNDFRFIYAKGNGSLYFYVGAVAQNAPIVNLGRIQETYTTKSMVDGQVEVVNKTLVSNVSLSNTIHTYDLSDYIPNDGFMYEIQVGVNGATPATSGVGVEIRMGTDISPLACGFVGTNTPRTAATVPIGGNINLVVGAERKLYLQNASSSSAFSLTFLRLGTRRRLGTNL